MTDTSRLNTTGSNTTGPNTTGPNPTLATYPTLPFSGGFSALAPLFVLRHGETEWNRAYRLQGQKDSELTELGKAQARAMGERLAVELKSFATAPRFIVSPLKRTRRTASFVFEVLEKAKIHPAEETRLRMDFAEVGFGEWEGSSMSEIEVGWPEMAARRREDPWLIPPGGESYRQVAERVIHGLKELVELQAEVRRPTVLVTHGGIVRILRALWGEVPFDRVMHLDTPQDGFFLFDHDKRCLRLNCGDMEDRALARLLRSG